MKQSDLILELERCGYKFLREGSPNIRYTTSRGNVKNKYRATQRSMMKRPR